MSSRILLVIRQPNPRLPDSEEEFMDLVLTTKAKKLLTLCQAEGFETLEDLCAASSGDDGCPAICMTEGCDHVARMEGDQREGYCEACGGQTVVSGLVLAELI